MSSEKTLSSVPVPPPRATESLFGVAVEPQHGADCDKIRAALDRLAGEDAVFHYRREPPTGELVLWGRSELHLRTVLDRMQTHKQIELFNPQPRIPYWETVQGQAEGSYRHRFRMRDGRVAPAETWMRIGQLPRDIRNPADFFNKDRFPTLRRYDYDPDTNCAFVDSTLAAMGLSHYISGVEKGINRQMDLGVIAGYPLRNVICELFFGKSYLVDRNMVGKFAAAGRLCFREVFTQAQPVLLEAIVVIEIAAPSNCCSEISRDLEARQITVVCTEELGEDRTLLLATGPFARVGTYAAVLDALSGGSGTMIVEFDRYAVLPPHEQERIVEQRRTHPKFRIDDGWFRAEYSEQPAQTPPERLSKEPISTGAVSLPGAAGGTEASIDLAVQLIPCPSHHRSEAGLVRLVKLIASRLRTLFPLALRPTVTEPVTFGEVARTVGAFLEADSNRYVLPFRHSGSAHDLLTIVFTDVDVTGENEDCVYKEYLYGRAYPAQSVAIVNVFQLYDADPEVFANRCVKATVHELGHLLGLGATCRLSDDKHCAAPLCVMQFASGLTELDHLSDRFCEGCMKQLRFVRNQLGSAEDPEKRHA